MILSPTKEDTPHSRLSWLRVHPILTTVGVVMAMLVSIAIGVALLIGSGHRELAESRYQWPALIGYLILGAAILLVAARTRAWRELGLRAPVRWWPCAPIALILILHFFETNSLHVVPSARLVIILGGFALLIGVVEEILFRGLLVGLFGRASTAVVVSTLVFGLIHASRALGATSTEETILTIAFALIWGLFAALTYLASGSIVPLIGLHMGWDWWSLMDDGAQHPWLLGVTIAVMLAWSLVLIAWLSRHEDVAAQTRLVSDPWFAIGEHER